MRKFKAEYLKPSTWWRVLERQIIAFAKDSQRDPEEFKIPKWRRYGLEIAFGVAIFAFFITTFAPTLAFQFNRWFTKAPVVAFTESRWHVLPEQGPECEALATKECYGHPENPTLWKSSHLLSDKDHQQLVEPLQGKKFWVGLEISADEAKLAFENRAGMFEIGVLNAAYRVFLNGVLAGEGSGLEYIPAEMQIPLDMLESGSEIRVGIEINHNLESRLPAWFGAKDMSGLFDYDTAAAYRGYWIFLFGFRALALASWSLLLAVTFISLWTSSPRKGEYFYFGLFLFIVFLTQMMMFGPIKWGTPRSLWYATDFWLRACEGCVGCLLGASFARVKKAYFGFALLVSTTVIGLGYFNSKDSIDLLHLSGSLAKIYVPSMLLLGAAFCISQAIFLSREKPKLMNERTRSHRVLRLIGFGLLLTFCASTYHIQSLGFLSTQSLSLWYRPIQMTLLALIGIYIFADYKERERVFDLTQRSPFHDPFGGSAKPVYGYLLALDLKRSSVLTEYAARKGISLRATTLWNGLIGQIMMKSHGFKVADEGDGLKVFFEGEQEPQLFMEILKRLTEAEHETRKLEAQLKLENLIPESATLHFRSGLVWGGLNPIWKEYIGVKSPEWEDANGYTTFTTVQRVMDYEKSLGVEHGNDQSVLTTPIEDLSNIEISERFHAEKRVGLVKDHGHMKLMVITISTKNSRANVA